MLQSVKKELKELSPIAIPAVFSQLAQMAMGFIDTVMAGNYSADALAAIAIGTSLLHPVMVFFLGVFIAFNPIVAHFQGEGKTRNIRTHFHVGIILALLMSPIAIILLFNSDVVLTALNIDAAVAELAMGYLQATLWGFPALFLFFALRFCNEGMFSTMAVLAITGSSIPFNVIFNYWFIHGGFGVEEMGAVGVGYATALIWCFMFIGMLLYTLFAKKYVDLKLFKDFELPNKHEVKEIFALGIPVGVTLGFEITMFAGVSLLIARYPVEVMGAHQIALNIASVFFMIPLGMSQAITARVSYFVGKKDQHSMRIAGYTGLATCTLISIFSSTMMILIPTFFISIYTSDPILTEIAISLLFLAALFQFSDAIQVASAGALRGLKDTKLPMVITAISYWVVGIPAGYYLAEYQGFEVKGYWIGMILALTIAAIFLMKRWITLSKRMLKITSSPRTQQA